MTEARVNSVGVAQPACIQALCEAPVACGGFGYCRRLNFEAKTHPLVPSGAAWVIDPNGPNRAVYVSVADAARFLR